MLLEKISEEEIEFMQCWNNPITLAECLFSNADNLALFNEEDFIELRMGQYPMLSFEYIIDVEFPNLTPKQKFALREAAGNIFCFGGRLFGKSWTVEKIDLLLYILCSENEDCGFSSFDMMHIRGILEPIIKAIEYHPIITLFKNTINRSPSYLITTKTGLTIESVNQNMAAGQKAGDQYFQKHFKRLYIEEASKENNITYEKRAESKSEIGCVYRVAGMTDFTKHSPAGKTYFDRSKKQQVLNLPQYVNPNYDDITEQQAIEKYQGKQSIGFRVFVDGEIVEEGISALDMEVIRDKCYPHTKDGNLDEKNIIKNFEFDKTNFIRFQNLLIVERPINSDRLLVCADIGNLGGTTEIIIMAEVSKKWSYLYNITLRNLSQKQQYKIFKYLYQRLNADYVALDTTDGTGRGILEDLELDPEVDKNKLIKVGFNENIEVGIVTDNEGNPVRDNGKLIKKYENTTSWSIQRLCYLLYEGLVFLKLDYKLDEQFNAVQAIMRGNTIVYVCIARENHLWQAFQVFAIAQFLIEYSGFTKKENSFNSRHDKAGV